MFLGLKLLDYYYFHFRELSQTFPDVHYFFRHYISPFSALMLLIIYVILKFDSYGAYDGISESSTVKEMKSIFLRIPKYMIVVGALMSAITSPVFLFLNTSLKTKVFFVFIPISIVIYILITKGNIFLYLKSIISGEEHHSTKNDRFKR